MEFMIGLAIGVAAGIITHIPAKKITTKSSATKHLDALSGKAQKALAELKQTQGTIANVGQKADAANRDLHQQISEMAA